MNESLISPCTRTVRSYTPPGKVQTLTKYKIRYNNYDDENQNDCIKAGLHLEALPRSILMII